MSLPLPEIPPSLVGSGLATLLVLYFCGYLWWLRGDIRAWLKAQQRLADASATVLTQINGKMDDLTETLREILTQRLMTIEVGVTRLTDRVGDINDGVRELLEREPDAKPHARVDAGRP